MDKILIFSRGENRSGQHHFHQQKTQLVEDIEENMGTAFTLSEHVKQIACLHLTLSGNSKKMGPKPKLSFLDGSTD